MSWIAIPAAVDCVAQQVHEYSSTKTRGIKIFLNHLRSRYQSAHFVSLLLDRGITTERRESTSERESAFFAMIYFALQQPATQHLYLREDSPLSNSETEEEFLNRVLDIVDFGLANDIKGLGITKSTHGITEE